MRVNCCAKNGASKRTGRGWGGKEGNACRQTPGFWKPPTWPVMPEFVHWHSMLSSAVIIHWPIKCLAFLGAEMNFRGRMCETKIINVIFCILDCVDGANGEISMNPNDQCRLCSFVLLIRLKGTTTRVKFWSFSSKLPESWIWRVKCDKHSSEVFRSATHIYTSSKLS